MPGRFSSNRRIALLFLLSVLLPCAVLTVVSFRSVGQERELSQKRAAEDRVRAAAQAREALRSQITATRAEAAAGWESVHDSVRAPARHDSTVRLVASLVEGRLVLPWEASSRSGDGTPNPVFARDVRDAERSAFDAGDWRRAAADYREALSVAASATDSGAADLGIARSLAKLGDRAAAAAFGRVLASDLRARDDAGVPLQLYAASYLANVDRSAVARRIISEKDALWCLNVEALYLLRDVLDTLAARRFHGADSAVIVQLRSRVPGRLAAADDGTRLQSELRDAGVETTAQMARGGESIWYFNGATPWLVSFANVGSGTDTRALVVALDARQTLAVVNQRMRESLHGAQLSMPALDRPQWLTHDLSEFALVPEGVAPATDSRSSVVVTIATLVAVLGITLFGAYLLDLDLRRELQLVETRSQFVASVSHELKTPLTSIRMLAETMLLDRSPTSERRHEYLSTIVNESERLTRLLNNVLDLSKIERGQKRYHLEPVVLEDVVRRCAGAMEYPLAQEGFTLHIRSDEEATILDADRDALQESLVNLLTNAMKFSGASRSIEVAVRREADWAMVEVTDHGIGIEPAHVGRVTEKFYRAPTAAATRIPGTGLGLTLVDHMVKAHHGRLEIDSATGQGTTVRMRVPVSRAAVS